MEQFDQLLTCCVCLDRYRNPKLLPCQHSYCMEPCMEGLVDYVKRQVKCPECRAEHRIPYNGIQGFPTNFTLQKFLELHAEITGELPDPNADAIMSRCNVCSEKAYVNPCAHCDKKVCDDCKEAHCDILKREIARVNNQVKRGFHRIEECVQQVDRNQQQLQQNGNSVIAEIEEIHRRLSLALKERTDYLKNSVEKYLTTEVKNLKELKSNLDLELANIQSNSDLMEKHMSEDSCKWDDNELMDCKDIFIKMMDFIRNYDPGNEEYSRRIRFTCHDSVNEIARKILEIGELKINDPKPKETEDADIPIRSTGLARSKSDHRLVAEFRRREEGGSPPRRRFGESRYSREDNKSRTNFGRYNADDDDDGDSALRGGRFRSRFLRPDDDDESGNRKSLHIDDDDESRRPMKKERIKVVDTEDASRGPLSGTIRLADSSRIIQRLKEWEMFKLKPKKKEEPAPVYKFVPLKPNPALAMGAIAPQPTPKEDDEIDKIKKENKEVSSPASTATVTTTATASAATTAASRYTTTPIRPPATVATPAPASQVAPATTLTKQESQESTSSSSEEEKKDEPEEEGDSDEYEYYDYDEDEEEEATPAATTASKATTTTTTTTSKASSTLPALTSVTNTAARSAALAQDTSAPERKYSYDYTSPFSSRTTTTATTNQSQPSSYGSTYASMRSSASTAPTPPAPTVAPVVAPVPAPTPPTPAVTTPAPSVAPQDSKQSSRYLGSRTMPNIGNVLNSSQDTEDESSSATAIAEAARNSVTARYRRIRDDSDSFVNKYLAQSRGTSQEAGAKTSASMSAVSSAGPSNAPSTSSTTTPLATRKISDESQYPSGRSRYAALKERKSRVARSKSSAVLGMDASPDDDEEDGDDANEPTPFTSRFGRELAKSRSSHFLKSEDASNSTTEDDNLSSWARYLKNKYGGRKKNTDNDNATTQNENNLNANNNNNRNANTNSNLIVSYSGPRGQYLQKQSLLMTFGSRGSQPGLFTWPRGIAVGPDNSIVVADSSNHRVQIFNEVGQHRFSFGCYGNGDGEFDCLAGVAVNRIGQYIIADRYNHRIQIFDPSGHFLRAFGSQGTTDGKFSYPWGITTDALGFIYVCDKENHRIQVFQSDGTFVGKFGTMGSKPGQLEHPHYIAVSNTNRVIVSDSNNHRIQIFDVNGKVLTMFGSEGTDEGQFKFPRGVAVDEQGYIFVADSGNNRIQIFNPDGTFLRGFGRWGQGEGEFKGLEGIAVNSKGNILVADRENHRVQMF